MEQYKLEKYWDDALAEYYYRLVLCEKDGNRYIADGGPEWAKRQSERYKIEITLEEEK